MKYKTLQMILKAKKSQRNYEIDIEEFFRLIRNEFGLELHSEFKVFEEGEVNLHILTEDSSKKYVICVFRPDKPISELQIDLDTLNYIIDQQFPTPRLYKTIEKKLYSKYRSYPFSIFEFIDGHTPEYSESTFINIGKSLAELHTLSESREFKNLNLRSAGLYNNGKRVDSIVSFINNNLRRLRDYCEDKTFHIIQKIPKNLHGIEFHKCSEGYIHSDVVFHNLKQMSDGKVYFLDFDDWGTDRFILDWVLPICYECTNFNSKKRSESLKFNIKLLQAYLKGYLSIRKIKINEIEKFWDACKLRIIDFIGWMIWHIIYDKNQKNSKIIDHWNLLCFLEKNYKDYLIKQMMDLNQ